MTAKSWNTPINWAAIKSVLVDNEKPDKPLSPSGEFLSIGDLPKKDFGYGGTHAYRPQRWTIRLRLLVVMSVAQGVITLSEVLERYSLSIEEFMEWREYAITLSRHHSHNERSQKFFRGLARKPVYPILTE